MRFSDRCNACYEQICVCHEVDNFFNDDEIAWDLEELEAYEKGNKRCIVCYNFNCRCKAGHADRLKKVYE